jgi:hypothetical protein
LWKSYDDKLESIQRQREYHERELVDLQKRKLNDDFVLKRLIEVLQGNYEVELKELILDIEYRQIKMERDIEYRQIKMELEDKNGSRKILRNQAHYVKFFYYSQIFVQRPPLG